MIFDQFCRHFSAPQTWNINAHFIAPNPPTSMDKEAVCPCVHPTAYVGPFSSVIGDVTVGGDVFIAPLVSVRADEGTPFFIGEDSNLQDGVILHGLAHGRVIVAGKEYSIFIGRRVSCAHGCIIHGPCLLGDDVFVGFNAIVFNAAVGRGSYISTGALVTGGVRIAEKRFVPPGMMVDTQQQADALPAVPKDQSEFAKEVIHVNTEFPSAYSLMFGATRCSCGLACDPCTIGRVVCEEPMCSEP